MRDRAASKAAGAVLAAGVVVAVAAPLLAGWSLGTPRPLSQTERVVYDRIVSSRHVAGARGPVRAPNLSISGCTLRSVTRQGTVAAVRGTAFIRPTGEIAIRVHEDAAGTIEVSLYACE